MRLTFSTVYSMEITILIKWAITIIHEIIVLNKEFVSPQLVEKNLEFCPHTYDDKGGTFKIYLQKLKKILDTIQHKFSFFYE